MQAERSQKRAGNDRMADLIAIDGAIAEGE
jgi:hypothetical protein